MLILTRRISERIVIDEDIYIKVMAVKGRQVLIGIDAPDDVSIHREEVQERIDLEGSIRENKSWRYKLQINDMLTDRYIFSLINGDLHFISEDKAHEGRMTMTQQERLNLFINTTRLLDTASNGDNNA